MRRSLSHRIQKCRCIARAMAERVPTAVALWHCIRRRYPVASQHVGQATVDRIFQEEQQASREGAAIRDRLGLRPVQTPNLQTLAVA